jgi:hypothetical protein
VTLRIADEAFAHFVHLASGSIAVSVGESVGVPFLFRSFEVIDDDDRFQPDRRPVPSRGTPVTGRVPELRQVVRFPDEDR